METDQAFGIVNLELWNSGTDERLNPITEFECGNQKGWNRNWPDGIRAAGRRSARLRALRSRVSESQINHSERLVDSSFPDFHI